MENQTPPKPEQLNKEEEIGNATTEDLPQTQEEVNQVGEDQTHIEVQQPLSEEEPTQTEEKKVDEKVTERIEGFKPVKEEETEIEDRAEQQIGIEEEQLPKEENQTNKEIDKSHEQELVQPEVQEKENAEQETEIQLNEKEDLKQPDKEEKGQDLKDEAQLESKNDIKLESKEENKIESTEESKQESQEEDQPTLKRNEIKEEDILIKNETKPSETEEQIQLEEEMKQKSETPSEEIDPIQDSKTTESLDNHQNESLTPDISHKNPDDKKLKPEGKEGMAVVIDAPSVPLEEVQKVEEAAEPTESLVENPDEKIQLELNKNKSCKEPQQIEENQNLEKSDLNGDNQQEEVKQAIDEQVQPISEPKEQEKNQESESENREAEILQKQDGTQESLKEGTKEAKLEDIQADDPNPKIHENTEEKEPNITNEKLTNEDIKLESEDVGEPDEIKTKDEKSISPSHTDITPTEELKQDTLVEEEKQLDDDNEAEKSKPIVEEGKIIQENPTEEVDIVKDAEEIEETEEDDIFLSVQHKEEDKEVPLPGPRETESENGELNLSHLKEQSFEGNLEAQLDKTITSAKKEYFDLSESDRDLQQFEQGKEPDSEEFTPKKLSPEFQLNDDSVPETDHPTCHPNSNILKDKALTGEEEKAQKAVDTEDQKLSGEKTDKEYPESTNEPETENENTEKKQKDLKSTDEKEDSCAEKKVVVEEKPQNMKSLAKKKEIEEFQKEEEVVELAIELYDLPAENATIKGSTGYNLDNLEELEKAMADKIKKPVPKAKKLKTFMKKPSYKPKKPIEKNQKLDQELDLINLTKDEAEKRISVYMSSMILNKLKSPKWESKVIGIQWMQEWIVENEVPPDLTEYAFRILKGSMKEWKEKNTNMIKSVIQCIHTILSSATRMGRRPIAILVPFLCEKLVDNLVKDQALESILLCAELNNECFGACNYTIKQLTKYGPKTSNNMVVKEIFS